MKVALIHDWLNTKFGGAENVLLELAQMYPDAPIYTLLYDPVANHMVDATRVRTSFLQRLPAFLRRRPRYLLPFIPTAVEQFDLSSYDLVISSSSAWVKGVITKPETLHICYCHTPMRFVWDYWPRYVNEQAVGFLRRAAIYRLASRARVWDYYSSARVDSWIANSKTAASRIRKYYHQEVQAVVYPGAELSLFSPSPKGDYFVTLSTLTPYKKIDLAIAACNRLGLPLKVLGEGADRARLEEMAGPTIEFCGWVTNETRRGLLSGAKALLFPNEEDFGIVPVEAMASGTPVIAYGRGGATETIIDGTTGILFDDQTVEGMEQALTRFSVTKFKTADLVEQSRLFSNENFREKLHQAIKTAYDAHSKS